MKTTARVLRFPVPVQPAGPSSTTGLYKTELDQVQDYGSFDPAYGDWTYSSQGLPVVRRTDLMPAHYIPSTLPRIEQFASFFTITDIHITDKEAPNQFIYLQQEDATFSGSNTSIYSPVMAYTTQVLDAAIQTVNALHGQAPFDFGLSLGDAANSTSYNELRWYIDVIDGRLITPSSGAHLGATTVDYQMPYQAAGLDRSIPFYQAIGNHDHFLIGSFPVRADPSLGFAASYLADTVWATPDVLVPWPPNFPRIANMDNLKNPVLPVSPARYYQGVFDGSSQTGAITGAGPVGYYDSPPKVVADPDRRSLLRTEWIQEFFDTTSNPVGHGFALVEPGQPEGFACYSFLPEPGRAAQGDRPRRHPVGDRRLEGHPRARVPRRAPLGLAPGGARRRTGREPAHDHRCPHPHRRGGPCIRDGMVGLRGGPGCGRAERRVVDRTGGEAPGHAEPPRCGSPDTGTSTS